MIQISFSPIAAIPGSPPLAVTFAGETLNIDGDTIDFSVVPEGGRVAEGWRLHPMLAGAVERTDGVVHLTLLLPYSGATGRHVETPPPIIDPPDGALTLPDVGGA